MAPQLLSGEALRARAEALGIDTSGGRANTQMPIILTAPDHELQRRVIEAERHLREHRLWWIALISAIASVVSAATALFAVFLLRA